ncbi:Hypothetical predicted protein [Mytilus galloprovincialis]|uniref:PiggyBac transposable element-derived protein domain-containing protein n=1 Tax=Mytilus galloprovincialis TaxID=29158 RepID=A0A8B6BQQ2_MYTGA|nr:Hypothetical predicted protein [Mytilus galloprovincialis]
MATPPTEVDDEIDFDDYEEPYTDEGMSEEEEDYLDYLLGDNEEEMNDFDDPWIPADTYISSQSSVESSSSSCTLNSTRIYWKDENSNDDGAPDPRTVQFKPNKKPGIQFGRLSRHTLKLLTSPVDFFKLFLTGMLLTSLCLSTNQHAAYHIRNGKFQSYAGPNGSWEVVTEQEMEKFIGILIYMSFMKLSSVDRYWSRDALYRFNPVPSCMSCVRFKAILSFLQITPLPDVNKDNKLTRVEPIIEHVRNISRELFQPYEKIAVDERIVKSKHKWSGIRQFMKDKPVKFGIKLWVLADTITGYTCDFYVYLGKKRTQITDLSKGLAYSVVMNLMPNYCNQGYRLFIDSFYTTLNLINDLLDKKVYTIGAVRGNSTAKPSVFKKNDGWEKLAGRGDFRWHRESRFLTVQWKDCKVVTIVSPIHTGSKVSGCTRTFQARTGWKKQVVKQPECIKSYNDGMFGVDKSNQYLSRHRCYIKTKFHWWKVLFFHCLDMMVVNSFILFQEFRTEFPNKFESIPAHFGQLEFRESLVRSLLDVGSLEKKHESFACTPIF